MSLEARGIHFSRVVRSLSDSRLRTTSKILLLEEGLEVAWCNEGAGTLAFCELVATSPADGWSDDVKIFIDDEAGDCAADDANAWVETVVAEGNEARLLRLKSLRSRSPILRFAGALLMFGGYLMGKLFFSSSNGFTILHLQYISTVKDDFQI